MAEQFSEFHIDLIKQVGLGINITRTYPKGHPSLLPVIQRLKLLLKEIPLERESISMVMLEQGIMIDDIRYDSKRLPIVKSLVERFNRLKINSITIHVDTTDNDLKEFFSAMTATAADIDDYGDIETLIKSRGIIGIEINKFRVGVIGKDDEFREVNWGQFLDSMVSGQSGGTDEERAKHLGSFLTGVGVVGNEPEEVQTEKIVSGLEKLALMVADQYGEDRWDEYSLVFARMLAVLSPNIKKNIVKTRAEHKKLATLFRGLIPTMSDQDIVDIIAVKAKEKTSSTEEEIIDILRNVTGARLPSILSTIRVNVPHIDFENIAARLMSELRTTEDGKFSMRNLEMEMRQIFPKLRDSSCDVRMKAIDSLLEFSKHLFEKKNFDLIRLLVDRLDNMADAETDTNTFMKIMETLKGIYVKLEELEKYEIIRFISKKFGRHLMRKEAAFLEKKKIVIKTINEVRDKNYVAELISLLWDPGTFVEAREALISLSEDSTSLLIATLKETEDRAVRMKIIDVLVRIGERAIIEVKKLLSSPEWFVRRNGVFLLGEMKVVDALDDIAYLINDSEGRVQLEVVDSLHKIGGKKAYRYIKEALNSKHRLVIIEAMKFLKKDDVKHRLGEVASWLKSRKNIPDKKEEKRRSQIIDVLGMVGDDSVIDTLAEIFNEGAFFKGDLLRPTKEAALNALSQIGSKNAMSALHDAANHKDHFVAAKAQEIIKRKETKHPKET